MTSNLQRLEAAIRDLAAGAAATGTPINVSEAGLMLSSTYSQSGMTIDAICTEIERAAAAAGATLVGADRRLAG